MRTQEEIAARINSLLPKDFFGFETSELIMMLDYEHAKEFLKPEVKPEEWKPDPNTADAITSKMREYMDFAWEKANGCRGISASRSMSHYAAWTWLLGDEGKLPNLDNYSFYGKDNLVAICKFYGWDHTKWDNGERRNL